MKLLIMGDAHGNLNSVLKSIDLAVKHQCQAIDTFRIAAAAMAMIGSSAPCG